MKFFAYALLVDASTAILSSSKPSYIFVDFDGTLSTIDTTELFSKNIIKQMITNDEESIQKRLKEYDHISDVYFAKYKQFVKDHPVPDEKSSTQELNKYEIDRAEFDRRLMNDLSESLVIRGTKAPWKSPIVGLRIGASIALHELLSNGSAVNILSLSTSGYDINSILNSFMAIDFNVISNYVELDKDNISSGSHAGNLHTGRDKPVAIQNYFKKKNVAQKDVFTVMIGDSSGDIYAMLDANVGILIGLTTKSVVDPASGVYTKQYAPSEREDVDRWDSQAHKLLKARKARVLSMDEFYDLKKNKNLPTSNYIIMAKDWVDVQSILHDDKVNMHENSLLLTNPLYTNIENSNKNQVQIRI